MNRLEKYYKGKNIVITGASSGIGRDLALLLASYGANLAISARRLELVEEVGRLCREEGGEVLTFRADVTDRSAMEAMADYIVSKWSCVDIVIANAGIGGLNPAYEFDQDANRRTVEVNLLGTAHTLIPFIPCMMERKTGILVGISSLAGFRGLPCAASYSSSKAGQKVFMESLRVDLRKYGISAVSIHPGFIETPMTAHEDFRMPFMVPVRKSSLLIARAVMKKKPLYLYPWQMRVLTYVNRLLPAALYDRLLPALSGIKQ